MGFAEIVIIINLYVMMDGVHAGTDNLYNMFVISSWGIGDGTINS